MHGAMVRRPEHLKRKHILLETMFVFESGRAECVVAGFFVRVQITTGPYRTKHGQATRAEFIEEFTHIEHVQAGKTNSSMNFVWIA